MNFFKVPKVYVNETFFISSSIAFLIINKETIENRRCPNLAQIDLTGSTF